MAATAREFSRLVRGNPMAKAALENAVWDLEAQREGVALFSIDWAAFAKRIPCGVSLGIQKSIPDLHATSSSRNWPPVTSASS